MDKARGMSQRFRDVRALVIGLAREGTALARFLAERGAKVTVTDAKSASQLADSMAALADWPITYALGGHPLALLDEAEIVFVSPGVPSDIPLLAAAQRKGLPLSSETRLFTRLCPAPILGITGSSGKTTTTALVGEMLKLAGFRTWVGGNIGHPLIGQVERIAPSDIVVMELSSFQLEFFAPWAKAGQRAEGPGAPLGAHIQPTPLFDSAGWSPRIAAVLNITPNHLDRHPTMQAYIAAKTHILAYQRSGDTAVLGLDNAEVRQMARTVDRKQHVLWFSMKQRVEEGAYLQGERLILRLAGQEWEVCRTGEIRLLGRHNVANVLAASTLAGAAGAPVEALRRVATTFRGVEHRLELVRERSGVRWYNDSIATTPERTVAALRAFDSPVVLLAGGRDKHLPWNEMADLTWKKVRTLILFGEAASQIEQAMRASPNSTAGSCQIHQAGTLERAVELAARLSKPGDVVLLSPGGTSFDAYVDFTARGEYFRQLVKALG